MTPPKCVVKTTVPRIFPPLPPQRIPQTRTDSSFRIIWRKLNHSHPAIWGILWGERGGKYGARSFSRHIWGGSFGDLSIKIGLKKCSFLNYLIGGRSAIFWNRRIFIIFMIQRDRNSDTGRTSGTATAKPISWLANIHVLIWGPTQRRSKYSGPAY